jgi:hypothetical protein
VLWHALTIFLGAFLLFQVQPLMGKFVLPWFGGGPGVWTTCMLFFQWVLLGGYAYAHLLTTRLKPRAQAVTHVVLLLLALCFLPITPGNSWKPAGGENPTGNILLLLAACLGLPYFVLSATGPLIQSWFGRTFAGRSPYRLYALSNVGSLCALLSYPLFFESHFTRQAQAKLWQSGLGLYVLCCGVCAWRFSRANPDGGPRRSEPIGLLPRTSSFSVTLWLLLPACASALLLAATNKLCQDVAVIPLLWVVPLAVYLLSFIVAFDSPRWYRRVPFMMGLVAATAGILWALRHPNDASVTKQLLIYCGGLFVYCMVCHGELYRLRPPAAGLTAYYLVIAAGGALGGLFVAIGAPRLFHDFYELHCGIFLCWLLFLLVCLRDGAAAKENSGLTPGDAPGTGQRPTRMVERASALLDSWAVMGCLLPLLAFIGADYYLAHAAVRAEARPFIWAMRGGMWLLFVGLAASWIIRGKHRSFRYWRWLVCLWSLLGVVLTGQLLWAESHREKAGIVQVRRNFYGVLKVFEHNRGDPERHHLVLQHGRITHGLQLLDGDRVAWPTTYYGADSGIGLALRATPGPGRRMGLVGLGAGTLTAYGLAGDYIRLYEINPDVVDLARTHFAFLKNCAATVEIAVGDARLSMEREEPQKFDLLALDAFSSDSIPVHLLTREAFQIYERHLKTNGILAVHISNHFLDLEPVVRELARTFHYRVGLIDYDDNEEEWWLYSSTWMLLSKDNAVFDFPPLRDACSSGRPNSPEIPLWTDDFTSVYRILK